MLMTPESRVVNSNDRGELVLVRPWTLGSEVSWIWIWIGVWRLTKVRIAVENEVALEELAGKFAGWLENFVKQLAAMDLVDWDQQRRFE